MSMDHLQAFSDEELCRRQSPDDFTPPAPLPGTVRPGERSGKPGRRQDVLRLSSGIVDKLQRFSGERGADLRSILAGAWAVLLSRYSGVEDVLFGIEAQSPEFSLSGGLFRILPLRLHIAEDRAVGSWLSEVAETIQRLYLAGPSLAFPDRRLFSGGILRLETAIIFKSPDPTPSHVAELTSVTGIPLVLYVDTVPELQIVADYEGQRLCEGAVPRILRCLKTVLEEMVADAEQSLSDLALMDVSQLQELLVGWNDTYVERRDDKCIHHLIEEQVRNSPEATAVIFQERQLSFRELNDKASRLAVHLQRLGAGPETVVGLCIDRSLDMMVALLAILKSGAAYLPLDPSFPSERLQFMLEDSRAHILVTQQSTVARYRGQRAEIVVIDGDWHGADPQPGTLFCNDVKPHNLAYVIYTSGSTGRPKGVMVEHRQVMNVFLGMDRVIGPEPGVWLAVTSISFDISVLELLWSLACGGTVVLQPETDKLATGGEYSIGEQIKRHSITHLQCTPSMAHLMLLNPDCLKSLVSLRKLMLGGEALLPALAAQLRPVISGDMFNLYGPTETTVWSAAYRVGTHDTVIPIGRPIANTQLYVLDKRLRPVPVGVVGELFIGGAGVARGYLANPDLTSERFLPNPFSSEECARIYKTGDLARYRQDGTIEFLGRVDNQVKILGFRIEPEEIESVLSQHPGVRSVAVVAVEGVAGEKRLRAYFVRRGDYMATEAELRVYLLHRLPRHMVPSEFVAIESMPTTPNGKTDKKAVVAYRAQVTMATNDGKSQADLERLMTAIFLEVLEVEYIGIADNFLDSGATSLLIADVAVKLGEVLNREIALTDFFQYPTIRTLASHLRGSLDTNSVASASWDRGQWRKDAARLRLENTPAQRRPRDFDTKPKVNCS